MSERTTIGGVVYESVGSSKSNLLLKCNGTARIQWGTKLIDLIKNGKIVSGDSDPIFIIQDESEIKSDGIYIINSEETPKLIIQKNRQKYNLNGTDLYISASKKQNLTVEQQKQAFENIGFQYATLEELQKSGMQEGLAYVLETKTLYTVDKHGIQEFEAKIKTVSVEKEKEEGETINSSISIVLSLNNDEYITIENKKINIQYPMYISDTASIRSKNYSNSLGYKLSMEGGVSKLIVDTLEVRQGLPNYDRVSLTFEDLLILIKQNKLETHKWYIIKNFANPWKLINKNTQYRPIMIKAISQSQLDSVGYLYEDSRITINYDPSYQVTVNRSDGSKDMTRGIITWMKDFNNNQANFDFLDYKDSDNVELATLHDIIENDVYLGQSVFPKNSYNNTLIVQNLWGTIINSDGNIDNTNAHRVDFQYIDDKNESDLAEGEVLPRMIMHDNFFNVEDFIVTNTCQKLYNNTFDNVKNTTITQNTINCTFNNLDACTFYCSIEDFQSKGLNACVFNSGTLKNVICRNDISNQNFDSTNHAALYDTKTFKELYFKDSILTIISNGIHDPFCKGMIMMHNGSEPIPSGWAICDGNNGTPNLIGRFIKAVGSASEVKEGNVNTNNQVTLTKDHLPKQIGEIKSNIINSSVYDTQTIVSGEFSEITNKEVTWYKNTAINIEPNYYALIFIMKL